MDTALFKVPSDLSQMGHSYKMLKYFPNCCYQTQPKEHLGFGHRSFQTQRNVGEESSSKNLTLLLEGM